MFFFMLGRVASVSDLRKRHSFIVLEKLYQMIRTRSRSRCNIADKNIWKREVVFEIFIAEVKLCRFLESVKARWNASQFSCQNCHISKSFHSIYNWAWCDWKSDDRPISYLIRPCPMSGGMKRRLSIGCAFIGKGKFVLLGQFLFEEFFLTKNRHNCFLSLSPNKEKTNDHRWNSIVCQ